MAQASSRASQHNFFHFNSLQHLCFHTPKSMRNTRAVAEHLRAEIAAPPVS